MAKVLYVTIQGILNGSNPDEAVVATSIRVVQTGQNYISDGPDITVSVKQGGAYKATAALNADVVSAIEGFVETQYGVSDFDHIYLIGGFGSL